MGLSARDFGDIMLIINIHLAYNILLLPEIIVSLTQSSGIQVPFGAGVFADTASALLGKYIIRCVRWHLTFIS